jgi:hypothetical protein
VNEDDRNERRGCPILIASSAVRVGILTLVRSLKPPAARGMSRAKREGSRNRRIIPDTWSILPLAAFHRSFDVWLTPHRKNSPSTKKPGIC